MTNMRFISPNALRARSNRQRRVLMTFGAPGALIAFGLHSILGFLTVASLASLWASQDIRLHGAEGEELTLGRPLPQPGSLNELPDHHILFNNLEVYQHPRAGVRLISWCWGATACSRSRLSTCETACRSA